MKACIITVSDRGAKGERKDESGLLLIEILKEKEWFSHIAYEIIPDDKEKIKGLLMKYADEGYNLILTTGGTGLAPRDVTPDATGEVIEKEVPGLSEEMRRVSREKTPHALLSRAIAGVRGETLIINLPGSPKGASENLFAIIDAIPHALKLLAGRVKDCKDEVPGKV